MARSRPIVVKTTVVLKLNSLVHHVIREDSEDSKQCCSGASGGRPGCSQVNKVQVSLPCTMLADTRVRGTRDMP